jgi:hypothetical protein
VVKDPEWKSSNGHYQVCIENEWVEVPDDAVIKGAQQIRPDDGVAAVGYVSRMLSLRLQKSPTPDFEEKCGNSIDISKGISQSGMSKFESSQVMQTSVPTPSLTKIRRCTYFG